MLWEFGRVKTMLQHFLHNQFAPVSFANTAPQPWPSLSLLRLMGVEDSHRPHIPDQIELPASRHAPALLYGASACALRCYLAFRAQHNLISCIPLCQQPPCVLSLCKWVRSWCYLAQQIQNGHNVGTRDNLCMWCFICCMLFSSPWSFCPVCSIWLVCDVILHAPPHNKAKQFGRTLCWATESLD